MEKIIQVLFDIVKYSFLVAIIIGVISAIVDKKYMYKHPNFKEFLYILIIASGTVLFIAFVFFIIFTAIYQAFIL
jgi:hypothetical protein